MCVRANVYAIKLFTTNLIFHLDLHMEHTSQAQVLFILGLCDNDKTYISITPPKLTSINDISIIFLHTI